MWLELNLYVFEILKLNIHYSHKALHNIGDSNQPPSYIIKKQSFSLQYDIYNNNLI